MRQLILVTLAACTPYDPDFGSTPFLCGPDEPRCPDGYTCIQEADTGRQVCSDVAPAEVDCVADPNEPNETIAMPTATTPPTMTFQRLALCPTGDVDVYAVTTTDVASIEILLTYDDGGATLEASVLNTGGVPIANAAPLEGTMIRALASDLDAGSYFVQVKGPTTGAPTVNNYALTINVQ